MISVVFKRNDSKELVSFELSGHAQAGPYGSDIVCAAVSALSISTINGIEALAGFVPIVEVESEQGGYLYMELIADMSSKQNEIAQILLENLVLAVQSIEAEHPSNVRLLTNEGGQNS
ncbi:ribosomal-processing cysteine protease Prp [Vagococcus entomophilus]|uniref:Ribosomal processing cysteine protease Prp n=1 Tax=Vagococcus entomophilus TaxID=1160095 RepID=A0A430AI98_9ENTE|nr:ribosomal-processing cysteine protease Prp [Vagococcus entomophilus]RSU07810.1 hypothetical protein CBF30_00795 [Vagococcus entomophilus]